MDNLELIIFTAPYCGHCKNMLAKKANGKSKFDELISILPQGLKWKHIEIGGNASTDLKYYRYSKYIPFVPGFLLTKHLLDGNISVDNVSVFRIYLTSDSENEASYIKHQDIKNSPNELNQHQMTLYNELEKIKNDDEMLKFWMNYEIKRLQSIPQPKYEVKPFITEYRSLVGRKKYKFVSTN